MVFLGELRVEAAAENMRTISLFVQAIGQRLRLVEKALFDIELSVDEAATNVMMHAYGDEIGALLITAEVHDDVLQITLTDWGSPFDPRDIQPFDANTPIEKRAHGGMGVHFITTLMDSVHYTPAINPEEPNTLILSKTIKLLPSDANLASKTQELNAVLGVSSVMGTYIDLDRLLERIVKELVKVIDAESGRLYLVDEAADEIFAHVLLDDGERNEIRVPIGKGIAGKVAVTGRSQNIQLGEDQSFDNIGEVSERKIKTMLVSAMHGRSGEIIGVVELVNKRGERFTSRDDRLLTAMAAQAAISVENARLYAQELQQQLISQELETARQIQQSFLPKTVTQCDGWDIAAFWNPMREVGGDFYDFRTTPDGKLAIVIADVSGKGIPAALFMAMSVTILRLAISLGLKPAEMMRHANQAILVDQSSKMFTTAFVGYLDCDSGIMNFASAGHNPPILYHNQSGSMDYLSAPGVALGVFKDVNFTENEATLMVGDILVLYTDGITEAINDDEEEFGEERLEMILQKHSSKTAQALIDIVIENIAEFAGEQGIFDDETIVIVKRS